MNPNDKSCLKYFLDHFESGLNYKIQIRCCIYQNENMKTCQDGSPDELVQHICMLTAQCDFKGDTDMKREVQCHLNPALLDGDCVSHLL